MSGTSANAAFFNIKQSEKDLMRKCTDYFLLRKNGIDCKKFIQTQDNAKKLRQMRKDIQRQIGSLSDQTKSQYSEFLGSFVQKIGTTCYEGYEACKEIHDKTVNAKNRFGIPVRSKCSQYCSASTCADEFTNIACHWLSTEPFNPTADGLDVIEELDEDGEPYFVAAKGASPICKEKHVKNCIGKNKKVYKVEMDPLGFVGIEKYNRTRDLDAKGKSLTWRATQVGGAMVAVAAAAATVGVAGPFFVNTAINMSQNAQGMLSNPLKGLKDLNAVSRMKSIGQTASRVLPSGESAELEGVAASGPSMDSAPSVRAPRGLRAGGNAYASAN